jgi:predicted DsbA family dithiol-disulfide isomerase
LTGNSRDSHKLVLLARDQNLALQSPLLDELYWGAFETGRDVSDREFWVETAVKVGLGDEDEVKRWLDSDAAGKLVDAENARARDIEISAVPSYIIQGRYQVGGCQQPEVFQGLFEKIQGKAETGKA